MLNSEVEPYIASHILTFTSEKMNVTTLEKAMTNDVDNKLMICGFSHEWNMLLTAAEELEEYYGLSSDGIIETLQNIAISIHWNGGSQNSIIPLQLLPRNP